MIHGMDCCAKGYEEMFDDAQAAKNLKSFRADGPDPTTRALLDMLRAGGVQDATLLDIGGGVGAIHHELLDAGAQRAIHVDASAAYIRAARDEAARRGHADRVEFLHGDFVDLAERVPPADVVTLDRVICCYPDMPALVEASAARARRLYGAVFPRDRWFLRLAFPFMNLFKQLTGSGFRVFLHAPADIDTELRRQGLERRSYAQTFVWAVAVYSRST